MTKNTKNVAKNSKKNVSATVKAAQQATGKTFGVKSDNGGETIRDRFGCRKGSTAFKINRAIDNTPKNAETILGEAKVESTMIYSHLATLVKKGFVIRTGPGLYRVKPSKSSDNASNKAARKGWAEGMAAKKAAKK